MKCSRYFVVNWICSLIFVGYAYNNIVTKVNNGVFSTKRQEGSELSQRTYIYLYLPKNVSSVKVPELQLRDCPLLDFIETVDEFTKDVRGSSPLVLQMFNKDKNLKIVFEDSHNRIRTSLNEASNTFPQLRTKVTMHITSFTSLKDIFNALTTSFNNKTDSAKLEVRYYGDSCLETL